MPNKKAKKPVDDGLHRFAWCWENDQYHANCILEYSWNDATVRCECPNHEEATVSEDERRALFEAAVANSTEALSAPLGDGNYDENGQVRL